MKTLLTVLLIIFSTMFAYAEYQAYNFSMSLKRPVMKYVTMDGKLQKTYALKSETIKGYLVTVCCYPCGASFGKGYPSWLFLKRSGDPTDSLWKIQCNAFGGLFGNNISTKYMEDNDFNQVTVLDNSKYMSYVKKTSSSWVRLEIDGDSDLKSHPYAVGSGKNTKVVRELFCGTNTGEFQMIFSGTGNAGWKWNYNTSDKYAQFNMYIKNASGSFVGWTKIEDGFSYDPSNYTIDYTMPVHGTFSMTFNNRLTEELRGTADWTVLSQRVYSNMQFEQIVKEELNEELKWDYSFYEF